jgi:transcription antitermination protein NusB
MKVWNRINARKVVLSYFYQRCFFHNLPKQNVALNEVLSVQNIFASQGDVFAESKKELESKIKSQLTISDDENLEYFVNIFFDKRKIEEIDMDYVFKVGSSFEKYLPEVINAIDQHTQSFSFSEMNTMNQSIFVLWYVERKVLETPKEILLNELIELAKRYDDEWSPKLINWIMHKIVNS